MAEPKTKPTDQDPLSFLATVEPKQKRDDSIALLEMFKKATGEKAVMWGTSIVGFGVYTIKSGKQENKWPLVAFSPRKQSLTLYLLSQHMDGADFLKKLGKYKVSGICLHIKKLSDVNQAVLTAFIEKSFQFHKQALRSF